MIYTLTLNPAIDYTLCVDDFDASKLNRSNYEDFSIGGKGINVSIILKELGIDSVSLGFVAGFTGQRILEGLSEKGINHDFIILAQGNSRINVKIKSDTETEINGAGPEIDVTSQEMLLDKINKLKPEDVLVLSGSVPKNFGDDFYEKIIRNIKDKNIRIVVDATKSLLLNTLKFKPFLIKPNIVELSELFGISIKNTEDVIKYAKKLQESGAQNVLVSLGKDGAILLDATGTFYKSVTPEGKAVNTVGAGDSMIAGFIKGIIQENNSQHALKLATACGSATAFSKGLANYDTITSVFSKTIDPVELLEK